MPPNLLNWRQGCHWRRKIETMLRGQITPQLKRKLRDMDPDSFFSDDLRWLEEARGANIHTLSLKTILSDILAVCQVRTYHACKPKELGSYLRRGLVTLNPEVAAKELRRLMGRHAGLMPLLTQGSLDKALSRIAAERREGSVWLGLDNRGLITDSGHYLIYGSEYVAGVLAEVGGQEYVGILKQEGIPTVFIVDLPLRLVSASDLTALAELLLAEWAQGIARGSLASPLSGFSFELKVNLPARHIVGHYHPRRIKDPLDRFAWHTNPTTKCPHCM